jgi:DNA-binding NarL/FixJ family response regulator
VTIRVLLVNDHRMVREALRDALAKVPDVHVVAEAGDSLSAIEQARTQAPDVIVLDIGLPDLNGMEVIDQACHPRGHRFALRNCGGQAPDVEAFAAAGRPRRAVADFASCVGIDNKRAVLISAM